MNYTDLTEQQLAVMQETFTTVWNGAKAQGFRQSRGVSDALLRVPGDSMGACAYRSTSGLRCNVGLLIPDDIYTPDLEFNGSWVLMSILRNRGGASEAFAQRFLEPDLVWFLVALQGCHDRSDPRAPGELGPSQPERHEQALRALAERYHLTIPGESNATA